MQKNHPNNVILYFRGICKFAINWHACNSTSCSIKSRLSATNLTTPCLRPWNTMECSQPAAWTTNRSLLVASRVRPFQEDRPIPARPYPELRTWMVVRSGVIWKCSGISRHATNHLALSRMLTKHQLHPCPHPTHHSHDYHTHTPTVTNPTAFHAQL